MRYCCTILLVLPGWRAFAQADSALLVKSADKLNAALLNRDTMALKKLLRDDIRYVHSNGWTETKRDVINDLYNGKLEYKKIKVSSEEVKLNSEVTGMVNMITEVAVELDGKPIALNLKVNQQWMWKNNQWQMFFRRSEKV